MKDPYQILGVSPSASDAEVTEAYRKLAKKYHPDLNPGDKVAEKRMQEINSAYEQIKNKKHGGASYQQPNGQYRRSSQQSYGGQGYGGGQQGDPFGGFGDFFGGYRQQQQHRPSSPRMQAVHNYIAYRQYAQALRALSEIDERERDGEWYYYSAIANSAMGNRMTAMAHAEEAVRREPNNQEYQTLLNQFRQGSFTYQNTGQSRGYDMGGMGRTMMQLCLAQLFCMFCCRGSSMPFCFYI